MRLLLEFIREVLREDAGSGTFYRVQPKGKSIFGHRSGLAYEKVDGIFAFTDPEQFFDTYTWIHVKKRMDDYDMVKFSGVVVDQPEDSEGVVVEPESEIERVPLTSWISALR